MAGSRYTSGEAAAASRLRRALVRVPNPYDGRTVAGLAPKIVHQIFEIIKKINDRNNHP